MYPEVYPEACTMRTYTERYTALHAAGGQQKGGAGGKRYDQTSSCTCFLEARECGFHPTMIVSACVLAGSRMKNTASTNAGGDVLEQRTLDGKKPKMKTQSAMRANDVQLTQLRKDYETRQPKPPS